MSPRASVVKIASAANRTASATAALPPSSVAGVIRAFIGRFGGSLSPDISPGLPAVPLASVALAVALTVVAALVVRALVVPGVARTALAALAGRAALPLHVPFLRVALVADS